MEENIALRKVAMEEYALFAAPVTLSEKHRFAQQKLETLKTIFFRRPTCCHIDVNLGSMRHHF